MWSFSLGYVVKVTRVSHDVSFSRPLMGTDLLLSAIAGEHLSIYAGSLLFSPGYGCYDWLSAVTGYDRLLV
jgi:hypothetical protein